MIETKTCPRCNGDKVRKAWVNAGHLGGACFLCDGKGVVEPKSVRVAKEAQVKLAMYRRDLKECEVYIAQGKELLASGKAGRGVEKALAANVAKRDELIATIESLQ